MWRKIVSVLAVFACFSLPALATPERLTTTEDRIFAATQTHLYVVRDVFDNLGSHYANLLDQHLVEISLDTGDATRFWPLRRMSVDHLVTDDLLVPGQVTERAGDVHDMMDILRELGAQPLSPHAFPATTLTLENGNLMQDGVQVATNFGIRKAGRSQLGILRKAYPVLEGNPPVDRINFYDLYAEGDWQCELRPERQTLFRAEDKLTLAKIYCEDDALSGAWTFHIFIKNEL